MSENSVPPVNDDDSDDLSAFDDFVNRHLDFEGRAKRQAADPSRPLTNEDDVVGATDDEDQFGRIHPPTPSLFSPFADRARTPNSPGNAPPRATPGIGSSPFAVPSGSSLPPRVPLPPSDDRRWLNGLYSVKGDMEIYYSQPFLAMRVLVIAEAHRRWNKRIRFIPNVAPGWAAVEIRTTRLLRGFVRQSEVKLMHVPRAVTWSRMFGGGPLRLDWLDIVIIAVVLVLLLFMTTDIDETLFYSPRVPVEALQTQVAEQAAQLETLQAQFNINVPPTAGPPH